MKENNSSTKLELGLEEYRNVWAIIHNKILKLVRVEKSYDQFYRKFLDLWGE